MTPWHVTMTWMIWGTPPFHVKMPLTNSPIHPGMWVRIWALLLILLELDVQNIPKRKVSELIAKCCNIHCYFIYIYMYIYIWTNIAHLLSNPKNCPTEDPQFFKFASCTSISSWARLPCKNIKVVEDYRRLLSSTLLVN